MVSQKKNDYLKNTWKATSLNSPSSNLCYFIRNVLNFATKIKGIQSKYILLDVCFLKIGFNDLGMDYQIESNIFSQFNFSTG